MKTPRPPNETLTVIAFRADRTLLQALDEAAKAEGLKRSHIARRAALRDLQKKDETHE
jgi:hypothetical protein